MSLEESELSSSLDIRGLPTDYESLKPVLQEAAREIFLEHGTRSYAMSISFVDDTEISRINEESLHRTGPTDVIAFDLSENGLPFEKVGDLYISIDTAIENSTRFGVSPGEEMLRLAVHGLLHVLGYLDGDPAGREKMTEVQERFVKKVFR